MRCKAVWNKLDRLSRQEIEPRMRERIEAHLRSCAECRQHLVPQERLKALLASAPAPPAIPGGFGERLRVMARQRQAERQSVPASLWHLRWLSPRASVVRKAAQAVALAAGLLIGVLMGQQTWRSAHSPVPEQVVQPDAIAVYELDYLTDAPSGSLVEGYLALTNGPHRNGT